MKIVNNKLTNEQKLLLFDELYRNRRSELYTIEVEIEKYITSLGEMFMPEKLKKYLKNKDCYRICLKGSVHNIIKMVDLGIVTKYYRYPIEYIQIHLYKVPLWWDTVNPSQTYIQIILDKCTEDQKNTLKNLVIKYLDRYNLDFDKFCFSFSRREFLSNVETWSDLYKMNESWYEIIYNIVSEKENINNTKTEIEKTESLKIDDKIKYLKNIIEI